MIKFPPRRALLLAFLVALIMIPVGLFLAAIGVWILKLSGGAGRDTSIVVALTAVAVTDFWGGGLVTSITRLSAAQGMIAWVLVRAVLLVLIGLAATKVLLFVPVMLAVAVPAAFAGGRVARKQAQLRRAALAADSDNQNMREDVSVTESEK